ncbi:hypothetical protein N7507_010525 [Penicillium longicatenatum]|nr:hypothetical protein N7507_010525 [Penicillium longicatenatum]
MPRHRHTARHTPDIAEINDLVARLYVSTPDVAEEVRELLEEGLQRRTGAISLPPRLLDRVVSAPDERRATLRDWIVPMMGSVSDGTTPHATSAPEHGSPAHRHETPAPRRTSRHATPGAQHAPPLTTHTPHREVPVGHHAPRHISRHTSRHATLAHQEAPVAHRTPRHTSRQATPGHHQPGDRRPTPARHGAPVAHHAPRQSARIGTPGHRHGGRHGAVAPWHGRHGRHEAPVSYIYEPVYSIGEQAAVPQEVLSRLTRPIVTQTMIDSEDAACVICQEDIKVGDEVMLLPCSHWSFHAACIEPWFRRSNTCPSCRQQVR